MEDVIRAEGLRKGFGGTQALDGVDLVARRGTVLGVLGPNGAGKLTSTVRPFSSRTPSGPRMPMRTRSL